LKALARREVGQRVALVPRWVVVPQERLVVPPEWDKRTAGAKEAARQEEPKQGEAQQEGSAD
jgi:hypothetical protein